jgi:alpha-tubulin suppressor-like RCC1 family protein
MGGRARRHGAALALLALLVGACTSILGDFSSGRGPAQSSEGSQGDAAEGSSGDDAGDGSVTCDGAVCASQVAANGNHTCAVLADGSVYCWGDDTSGAGGPNATTGTQPALVSGIGPAQSVRAGFTFTCALLVDESVWCWGDTEFGMLGFEGGVASDGGSVLSPAPVQVLQPGAAAQIAAGGYHACAKLVTGGVTCWGKDGFGQAGVAKTPQVDTPTALSLSDVNTVSAGSFDTCFQRSSAPHGECMGENVYGELGLGDAGDGGNATDDLSHPVPSAVDVDPAWGGVLDFAHSAGFHMGIVLQSGEIAMWGANSFGQLGVLDDSGTPQTTPALVPAFGGVVQLSLTQYATCARRVDGTVWCWGSTLYGQTGSSANLGPVQVTPAQVPGVTDATLLAAGFNHVCALLGNGSIDCWGWNASGQLGRATASPFDPVPAPVQF